MTETTELVSNEELSAFMDNELDGERAAQIKAAIENSPVLQAKFDSYMRQQKDLQTLFEECAAEPIPDRIMDILTAAPSSSTAANGNGAAVDDEQPNDLSKPAPGNILAFLNTAPVWMQGIAASIFLLVGCAIGWSAQFLTSEHTDILDPIVRQAVLAHQILESETPAESNLLDIENDVIVSVANAGPGFEVPIRAPTLADLGNISPVAFRNVTSDMGPTAQLMYRVGEGKNISLYVRAHSSRSHLPFNSLDIDKFNTIYWIDGPLVYVLVGKTKTEQLATMAKAIYSARGIHQKKMIPVSDQ